MPTALAVHPVRRGCLVRAPRSQALHGFGGGEACASGVPWGNGLRKGDLGRLGGRTIIQFDLRTLDFQRVLQELQGVKESRLYYRAPETARERIEGMKALSASAVSSWSF